LGQATEFIGIEIKRDRQKRTLTVSQGKYCQKIIERFRMAGCKPASTPADAGLVLTSDMCPTTDDMKSQMSNVPYRECVGALNYLVTCTRPDLAFSVGAVSAFLSNPGRQHWQAVKNIVRYIKGTINSGITYGKYTHDNTIYGYVDSDFARDVDSRKSISGYSFQLNGGSISWKSKKQPIVAHSTCEAEYVAASLCSTKSIYLRNFFKEIGFHQSNPTILFEDNKACIDLTNQIGVSQRTKHIDLRYHIIRDYVQQKQVCVTKVGTDDNIADQFTKPLPKKKFTMFRNIIFGLQKQHHEVK
jgi:hypothetical protein